MSTEPTPTRRPIGTIRVSTVALLGVVAAVTVPATAAALVMSGSLDSHQQTMTISQAGPVSRIVIDDDNSSIHIAGDPAMSGVTGHADLHWRGSAKNKPISLDPQYQDGVLTLTRVCNGGSCASADVYLQVPPSVSVQVSTSNGLIEVTDVSGGVDLTTSNAAINALRLGAGDAHLHTSNGPIEATFVGAAKSIRADTSNDPVFITTDGVTRYYDQVTTSNAETQLNNVQDRRSDYVIRVETSNEKVVIN